jgi:hypothetical protein
MRPIALAVPGLLTAFALGAEASSPYLQYDAVLEGEASVPIDMGSFALFLRYYITDEGFAAEVTHYEPRWNLRNFEWYPLGLAFYSDSERFTVYSAIRGSQADTPKPPRPRGPARASGYRAIDLAYSEAEILAALDAYRHALGVETDGTTPVQIERRDGRSRIPLAQ